MRMKTPIEKKTEGGKRLGWKEVSKGGSIRVDKSSRVPFRDTGKTWQFFIFHHLQKNKTSTNDATRYVRYGKEKRERVANAIVTLFLREHCHLSCSRARWLFPSFFFLLYHAQHEGAPF